MVRAAEASLEPPSSQALSPWSVELAGGEILISGAAVHPVIARDLWMRLGALLGQAEHDSEQAEWTRLSAELDRHFREAPAAHGRTMGRPSMPVAGLVLRERDDVVVFRLATFSLAYLKPTKRGWEGPVYALRPTSVGHDLRPLGVRVRLQDEAVAPMRRLELPGPAPRPPQRPAIAPALPHLPEAVERRRNESRAILEAILVVFPGIGAQASLDDVAHAVRLPRDILRDHLELLVERGELAETKPAPGVRRTWTRLARQPGQFDSRKPGTRFQKPTGARAKRAKAAPPVGAALRCDPCGRVVRLPAGVAVTADPRCKVCGGSLTRCG